MEKNNKNSLKNNISSKVYTMPSNTNDIKSKYSKQIEKYKIKIDQYNNKDEIKKFIIKYKRRYKI
jgi:hypothetical protein